MIARLSSRHFLAICLVLVLSACATHKQAEIPQPPKVEPQPAKELVRDKFIIPGERIGPVFVGMPLREMVGVVGEPQSSTNSRIPGGRQALLYRYADAEASPDGAMLILVREYDQTVYSIQVDGIDSYQTREGLRVGSSEALVRATAGKPQAAQESNSPDANGATGIRRTYCYLTGLAVRMGSDGRVESLTVFPGRDLRKICKSQ